MEGDVASAAPKKMQTTDKEQQMGLLFDVQLVSKTVT